MKGEGHIYIINIGIYDSGVRRYTDIISKLIFSLSCVTALSVSQSSAPENSVFKG